MKFEADVITNFSSFGVGLYVGSNIKMYGKRCNAFIELDFAFWTFGFEIKWGRAI